MIFSALSICRILTQFEYQRLLTVSSTDVWERIIIQMFP